MPLTIQTLVFFCFIFVDSIVNCRKYDLEQECMKLYGEDIPTVLQSFRRTPEYLSILNAEKAEISSQTDTIARALSRYYEEKMEEKIKVLVNYTKEAEDITTSPTIIEAEKPNRTSTSLESNSLRSDMAPSDAKKKYFKDKISRRRLLQHFRSYRRQDTEPDNPENTTSTTKTPKELLDKYEKLYPTLTLAERNQMRDLGFEYASEVIRSLIKNMGGVSSSIDDDGKSPSGGGKQATDSTTKSTLAEIKTSPGDSLGPTMFI